METGKESSPLKTRNLIIALCLFLGVLNLAVSGFVLYRLQSLSYLDIADAPSFFYTSKRDLYRYAAELGEEEGKDYLLGLKKRLDNMHGVIIDDNAVVASSSEFKLEFKNKTNKKTIN